MNKIECECGVKITTKSLKKHLLTKKHAKLIKSIKDWDTIILTNEFLKATITRTKIVWENEDYKKEYDFSKKLLIDFVKELNYSDYITSFNIINAPLIDCVRDNNGQLSIKTFIKFGLINEEDLN